MLASVIDCTERPVLVALGLAVGGHMLVFSVEYASEKRIVHNSVDEARKFWLEAFRNNKHYEEFRDHLYVIDESWLVHTTLGYSGSDHIHMRGKAVILEDKIDMIKLFKEGDDGVITF